MSKDFKVEIPWRNSRLRVSIEFNFMTEKKKEIKHLDGHSYRPKKESDKHDVPGELMNAGIKDAQDVLARFQR